MTVKPLIAVANKSVKKYIITYTLKIKEEHLK